MIPAITVLSILMLMLLVLHIRLLRSHRRLERFTLTGAMSNSDRFKRIETRIDRASDPNRFENRYAGISKEITDR